MSNTLKSTPESKGSHHGETLWPLIFACRGLSIGTLTTEDFQKKLMVKYNEVSGQSMAKHSKRPLSRTQHTRDRLVTQAFKLPRSNSPTHTAGKIDLPSNDRSGAN